MHLGPRPGPTAAALCALGVLLGVPGPGSGVPPAWAATVEPDGDSKEEPTDEPADRFEKAEEIRVIVRGGRSVTGLLVSESAGGVRVRVDGRELVVPASDVIHVEYLAPIEERYREKRAKISPGDTEMRLLLAEWLRDRERYGLALIEAEAVLGADPGHRRARTLVSWLRAQLVLEQRTRTRTPGEAEDDDEGENERGAWRSRADDVPLISSDAVNLIRVYEIDLQDPPRVTIPRPTLERLLTDHADHPLVPRDDEGRRVFLASRPSRQLDLMFRAQARELYADVRVLDDPSSMSVFRDDIHGRWLVQACASSGCHGGAAAGRLRFASRYPNRTETVYTNFLILSRFRLANGEGLIDFDRPEASAFLRAGLRRDQSERVANENGEDVWVHPEVPATRARRGWRAIFRGPDDRRYEEAVAWIKSLYRPRPEYPITYDPNPVEEAVEDTEPPPER